MWYTKITWLEGFFERKQVAVFDKKDVDTEKNVCFFFVVFFL